MKKRLFISLSFLFILLFGISAFAGEWKQDIWYADGEKETVEYGFSTQK